MKNMSIRKGFPFANTLNASLAFCGILAVLLLLSGCPNALQRQDTPSGAGTLLLTVGRPDAERTILPELVRDRFVKFDLDFVPAGDCTEDNEPFSKENWEEGYSVNLSAGIWDLTVTAFMSCGDAGYVKAARGYLHGLEVAPGETIAENVILSPIADGGTGTFAWRLSFPDSIVSARMEIFTMPSGDPSGDSPFYFHGGTGTTVNPAYNVEMAAGQYRVLFTMTLNNDQGKPETVTMGTILRVYVNMESRFEQDFTYRHFPLSLNRILATLYDGSWDFTREGIVAAHFSQLGIRGIDDDNIADMEDWFNQLIPPGPIPVNLEGLEALVDAALIGIASAYIGCNSHESQYAAETAIRELARNHSAIAVHWSDYGNMATVVVGDIFTLYIDFLNIAVTIPDPTPIASVAIIVDAPVVGEVPATLEDVRSGTNEVNFTVTRVSWSSHHSIFQPSTIYIVTIALTANDGYTFTGGLTEGVTVGGYPVDPTISEDGKIATLVRIFAETAPAPNTVSVLRPSGEMVWFNYLDEALDEITGPGEYTVMVYQNQPLEPWTLNATGTTRIILQGNNSTREIALSEHGSLFTIPSNVTFRPENITLRGLSGNTAPLVIVAPGGILYMGTMARITGNNNTISPGSPGSPHYGMWHLVGGGVRVEGTFRMSTGVISGNQDEYTGGAGVFVANGGTFNMTGGTIYDNHASDWGGGGVFIDGGGDFYMHGGIIEDNSAAGGGGGVHVGAHDNNYGIFTMSVGRIRSNESTNGGGGGVFVNIDDDPGRGRARGSFVMYGGYIYDNEALGSTQGGGVFTRGDFTMHDGTIFDNDANAGGGVNVGADGDFTMEGGTIYDNDAVTSGGGVSIGRYGNFSMRGGTIYGNTAVDGGGVNIDGYGTFDMGGGRIETNTATDRGGGVFVADHGIFRMSGGLVFGTDASQFAGIPNTANGDGASIFVNDLATAEYAGELQNGGGNIETSDFTLPYNRGDGTAENPFHVFTEAQLRMVGRGEANPVGYRDWTLSAHYVLMADISLASSPNNWTPIGISGSPFTGTFDGGFRTITGLRLDITGGSSIHAGMFGFVGENGAVRNIGLIDIDIYVNTSANANVFVGGIVGSKGLHTTVENSFTTGVIRGTSARELGTTQEFGGIAGSSNGTVRNTHSDVNITFSAAHFVGGLVGSTGRSAIVEHSFATGSINVAATAGGLVGLNHGTLRNSVALNPRIDGTGSASRNRVIGSTGGGNAINNHARDNMLVNGVTVTTGVGEATLHGASQGYTAWLSAPPGFWGNVGFGGADSPWSLAGGRPPILRDFAPGVHNPTVRPVL